MIGGMLLGGLGRQRVPAAGGGGPTRSSAVATDNFTRADATSLGANWTDLNPAWATADIVSNTARSPDETQDSSARWSGAGTFTADQWAAVTLATGSRGWDNDNRRIGVVLRPSNDVSANRDFYAFYMVNDADIGVACTCRLVKMTNGTSATLGTTTLVWADADVISAEILTVGGNAEIRCYRGVTLITAFGTAGVVTDSTSPFLGSNAPGIFLQGDGTRPRASLFDAGNMV